MKLVLSSPSRILVLALLLVFFNTVSAAGKLQSIYFQRDQIGYYVLFRGEDLKYTSSSSDNPPRIVLQFSNIDSGPKEVKISENPYVSSIRGSQKLEPGKTAFQVTVDLKKPADFSFFTLKYGFAMRLADQVALPSASGGTSVQSANPPSLRLDIGSEDLLEVTVFELPQFNVTTRVSGDGTITMPLIGSVKVAGLTKQEAEKKIATELEAKYVNNANVSVNIKEYKSKQIAIFGAVKSPGPYYLLSHRTLLQVITDAGGLTTDAGPRCFVFRAGNSKIEVNLEELMMAGNQRWNIAIYPGDVINIPTAAKVLVYVLGEVRSPGPIEMPYGASLTLLTAIARAGGVTANAKQSSIEITRKDAYGNVTLSKVNLKDVLKGKEPDVTLQPGDVINVPESFF